MQKSQVNKNVAKCIAIIEDLESIVNTLLVIAENKGETTTPDYYALQGEKTAFQLALENIRYEFNIADDQSWKEEK